MLLSFGLSTWGRLHPEPLEVSTVPVFALLLTPALLMAIWLFCLGRDGCNLSPWSGGSGESVQSDSEQEST